MSIIQVIPADFALKIGALVIKLANNTFYLPIILLSFQSPIYLFQLKSNSNLAILIYINIGFYMHLYMYGLEYMYVLYISK